MDPCTTILWDLLVAFYSKFIEMSKSFGTTKFGCQMHTQVVAWQPRSMTLPRTA